MKPTQIWRSTAGETSGEMLKLRLDLVELGPNWAEPRPVWSNPAQVWSQAPKPVEPNFLLGRTHSGFGQALPGFGRIGRAQPTFARAQREVGRHPRQWVRPGGLCSGEGAGLRAEGRGNGTEARGGVGLRFVRNRTRSSRSWTAAGAIGNAWHGPEPNDKVRSRPGRARLGRLGTSKSGSAASKCAGGTDAPTELPQLGALVDFRPSLAETRSGCGRTHPTLGHTQAKDWADVGQVKLRPMLAEPSPNLAQLKPDDVSRVRMLDGKPNMEVPSRSVLQPFWQGFASASRTFRTGARPVFFRFVFRRAGCTTPRDSLSMHKFALCVDSLRPPA